MAYVLAASLLAVIALVAWENWPSSRKVDPKLQAKFDGENKTTDPANQTLANVTSQLESFDAVQELLEAQLHQLEMARMEKQLAQLESQRRIELDRREAESMILALSDQVVLPLGGSEKTVQESMAQVIKKYPGSRGANIARQFLKQETTN